MSRSLRKNLSKESLNDPYVVMAVRKSTRDFMRTEVKEEFIKNNKQLEGVTVTDNMLLLRLCKYYVES
jgi:hypothetical protein